MKSLSTSNKNILPFLRLMICILFIPCFLLMNVSITKELYYIFAGALIYAAVILIFPIVNDFLHNKFPYTSILDILLISITLYYSGIYFSPMTSLYLFVIFASTFATKGYLPFFTATLSSISYFIIIYIKGYPLYPALTQILIFLITSFFSWFIYRSFRSTYYQQANQDGLTKVHNRRYFNHIITEFVDEKTPFALIIIDLDNFKILNDTQGHHHGDYVLKIIAAIMKECTRPSDIISRYGGDEFVIILPRTPKKAATTIGERIRNDVLVNPKLYPYPQISVSLGIARFPNDGSTVDDILCHADEALYQAKNRGKNFVYVY